jgi:hypothetical protein
MCEEQSTPREDSAASAANGPFPSQSGRRRRRSRVCWSERKESFKCMP